jgi:hypothetical protein
MAPKWRSNLRYEHVLVYAETNLGASAYIIQAYTTFDDHRAGTNVSTKAQTDLYLFQKVAKKGPK